MNLSYCILVTGPAYGDQRASSALQFSEALLSRGHYIKTIFFYQNGVYNANRFTTPALDEVNIVRDWQRLSQQHGIKLYTCISASLRRGIVDKTQSFHLNLNGDNMQNKFKLMGLGSLAKAMITCDRFIQF